MLEAWFQSLTMMQKIFALCAVVGGVVFLFRTILVLSGAAGDHDLSDSHDVGLSDTDVSFNFLSITGITAFFLMFGVAGLSLSRASGVTPVLALAGGVVAGLLTMWLIAKLFSSMGKLQSDGTLVMQNAVGQEGEVYLSIHPGGIGKVQITIQGGLSIFEARSDSTQLIPTGSRVKVVSVTPQGTLIVEKMA